jgi:glycosyltransferase involved in cell wall biosynthesis
MKKKLRILHLTHTDVRYDNRILKQLSGLNDAEIYELYAIGITELGSSKSKSTIYSACVICFSALFRSVRWLPAYARYVLVYIEILGQVLYLGLRIRPKLIHCHDVAMLPTAMTLAFMCRAKVIYDAHELESEQNGQTLMRARIALGIEKIFWIGVDGFVTVSHSILNWYANRFPTKDSAIVYNSPLFNVEDAFGFGLYEERYFHKKYGIPEDRLVFVYLGLLEPGRGIENMLQVFSMSPINSHVAFVGRGSLRDNIAACAGTNEKVHVHDVVSHDQVVPMIKSADYGLCMLENVSLSDYYALPNKLFEYAFAGVPVLASNFPDLKYLVERFDLGVCVESDVEAIVQNICLLQDRGRRRVTSNIEPLAWEEQAQKLRDLYRRVLSIGKSGSDLRPFH